MDSNLIYDIGMNNGDDSAYYLSLGYKVIAIDASPDLVEEAELKFKKFICQDKIEILNIGMAAEEGHLDFYLNKHDSVWNSFDKNLGSRGGAGFEIVKVKTTSLDKLISEKGVPYYLKMDIEGYDKICLMSLFECVEKPKYLSVELYDLDLINSLSELGYKSFKIIDQSSFLPLEKPSFKEYGIFKKHEAFRHSMNLFIRIIRKIFGRTIDKLYTKRYKYVFNYNHPHGSSGPFGEYLPGRWHTLNEISEVFLYYKNEFDNSGGDKSFGLWLDVHATY